ncbi:MAG: SH3 domain-containing protein, partial [Armatimonadetes bacterium]|nr:SH3 domain-containing protein [Anaerolineae bacterium]
MYPIRPFARLFMLLTLLTLLLTACNLGEEELPTPTPTLRPDASGKPSVIINSPTDGSSALINREILLSATATDQFGVTRMQLFANGAIVKTVASENTTGEITFSAVMGYTPIASGAVVLRVLAYRGNTVSDPREITVTVTDATTPISTITGGGNSGGGDIPVILPTFNPADPTCRVRIESGLNMRQGPGTSFGIIRVLSPGEILSVAGRSSDGLWWQVRDGITLGW